MKIYHEKTIVHETYIRVVLGPWYPNQIIYTLFIEGILDEPFQLGMTFWLVCLLRIKGNSIFRL